MSVELRVYAEDGDPEEGNRVGLAIPTDKPGFLDELFDLQRGEIAGMCLLGLFRLEGSGTQRRRGLSRPSVGVAAA